MTFSLPRFFIFLLRLFVLQFSFMLFWRLLFLFYFLRKDLFTVPMDTLNALYLGLKFDTRFFVFSIIPLLLLLMMPWIRLKKKSYGRKITYGYLLCIHLMTTLFYMVDFGHYSYLEGRLNSQALKFLKDFWISLEMVYQSYPVFPILLFYLFLFFLYRYFLKKIYRVWDNLEFISPLKKNLTLVSCFFLLALGGYGKISWYPLRWSEAYFSNSARMSSLATNPILFFFTSLGFKDQSYDLEKVKEFYPVVSESLGVKKEDQDISKLEYHRFIPSKEALLEGDKKPNVVLIVMESLAAYKTGHFGNTLNPTPYLDKLIKESLHFRRFYVPVQATARSIFGLVTGIPDISRVKTSSRNPLITEQQSVFSEIKSDHKFYFLGGSASWGNIRGIFSHNVKDINIMEEGDYTAERVDVWGLSDLDLFIEAHKKFDSLPKNESFVAVLQSSSFHRPYTIPEKRGLFKIEQLNKSNEELDELGFISEDEYNSLRFSDYSLGHFLELAKKSSYYENTIFIVIGDHGLPVGNADHVPFGERYHQLENFHTPLVIHAPKFFEAQEVNDFASELDLFPSIASFLGDSYTNTTLGQDLKWRDFMRGSDSIQREDPLKRDLFTYYWYISPATFGLLNEKFYFVGNSEGRAELYEYQKGEQGGIDVQLHYPEEFLRMKNLANGLFYTSQYLLYNNPHLHLGD